MANQTRNFRPENKMTKPFIMIPSGILYSGISASAFKVWAFLYDLKPSYEVSSHRISETHPWLSMSGDTYLEAKKELVRAGFLVVKKLENGKIEHHLLDPFSGSKTTEPDQVLSDQAFKTQDLKNPVRKNPGPNTIRYIPVVKSKLGVENVPRLRRGKNRPYDFPLPNQSETQTHPPLGVTGSHNPEQVADSTRMRVSENPDISAGPDRAATPVQATTQLSDFDVALTVFGAHGFSPTWRPTKREAKIAAELVAAYGLDSLTKLMAYSAGAQGQPYSHTVTSFADLKSKAQKIQLAMRKATQADKAQTIVGEHRKSDM